MGLAPLRALLHIDDTSLNIFLFIRIGATIASSGDRDERRS
jgi:hypothetical protein